MQTAEQPSWGPRPRLSPLASAADTDPVHEYHKQNRCQGRPSSSPTPIGNMSDFLPKIHNSHFSYIRAEWLITAALVTHTPTAPFTSPPRDAVEALFKSTKQMETGRANPHETCRGKEQVHWSTGLRIDNETEPPLQHHGMSFPPEARAWDPPIIEGHLPLENGSHHLGPPVRRYWPWPPYNMEEVASQHIRLEVQSRIIISYFITASLLAFRYNLWPWEEKSGKEKKRIYRWKMYSMQLPQIFFQSISTVSRPYFSIHTKKGMKKGRKSFHVSGIQLSLMSGTFKATVVNRLSCNVCLTLFVRPRCPCTRCAGTYCEILFAFNRSEWHE